MAGAQEMRFLMSLQPLFIHNAPSYWPSHFSLHHSTSLLQHFKTALSLPEKVVPQLFIWGPSSVIWVPVSWSTSLVEVFPGIFIYKQCPSMWRVHLRPKSSVIPQAQPQAITRLCMTGLTALCTSQLGHCRLPERVVVRTVLILSYAHLHFSSSLLLSGPPYRGPMLRCVYYDSVPFLSPSPSPFSHSTHGSGKLKEPFVWGSSSLRWFPPPALHPSDPFCAVPWGKMEHWWAGTLGFLLKLL